MKLILCASCWVIFAASLSAQQTVVTQLVVFGDSLSDNGNLYYGTGLLGDATPGPPGYATGEYTDGTNSVPSTKSPLGLWIEQLAPLLGVPVPEPYFSKGGLNFAVAGALTGSAAGWTPTSLTVIPGTTNQLSLFLAKYPSPPANYLYVFWCGGNDLLNASDPSTAATTAVANIQANITTLAKAGAKYFLWVNLPPVGDVPENVNTAKQAPLDAASVIYNTAWAAAITQLTTQFPGITIAAYDSYSGTQSIEENPGYYGFVNTTGSAQGQASVNPNTYVYWDVLHPTTAGHQTIAEGALAALAGAFENTPYPGAVVNAFGLSPVIAPNTWVAIKGAALSAANDTRTWATADFTSNNGQMPTALDGVSVTLNGENAYVEYISPSQINILTPPDLATGTVTAQVTANGQKSVNFPVQVQNLSPSFFAFDGTHVVATHLATGGSCPPYPVCDVGPTTLYPGLTIPAQPGEEVVLYANGFGPTSATVVKGAPTQGGTLPQNPVVTIGGLQANVIFAGLQSPGLYQFNVTVPLGAGSGDLPLTASFGGASTQSGVVITVQ